MRNRSPSVAPCAARSDARRRGHEVRGWAVGLALAIPRVMGILRRLLGKDTTTDILELLKDQHKEVDELFARLERGEGDRQALFTELADKLAAHAAAEEKVFYPSVMTKDTAELLQESVEEHLSVKR